MALKYKESIKEIISNPFWRNVATLFSGTAIAQALPIIIFPIITRIYTKEAIGFYFVYAAISLILQIISSLQYQLAIVLPKSTKEANTIFELSLILVFIISLVIFLITHLLFDFISGFIVNKEFIIWLYAIPLSTLFLGIFRVSNYYLNRDKSYKTIAYGKVSKSFVISFLQLIFGFIGFLKSGLIVSLIIGQAVSGLYLFIMVLLKSNYVYDLNWRAMQLAVIKYIDMPIYNTTLAVISAISNQLPLFFLSRYFGVGLTGDYGLSNRIVSTPMELIGTSIGQVFIQESSDTVNRGENLYQLVSTTYLRLFKLSVIPFFLLLISSYWIFPFVFGSQYQMSGIITMILIPWLFLHFLNSPQSFLFNVLNKQRFMTVFHSLFLMSRIVVLYIGYLIYDNIFLTIGLYSFIGVIFNIFLIFYYLKISKNTIQNKY